MERNEGKPVDKHLNYLQGERKHYNTLILREKRKKKWILAGVVISAMLSLLMIITYYDDIGIAEGFNLRINSIIKMAEVHEGVSEEELLLKREHVKQDLYEVREFIGSDDFGSEFFSETYRIGQLDYLESNITDEESLREKLILELTYNRESLTASRENINFILSYSRDWSIYTGIFFVMIFLLTLGFYLNRKTLNEYLQEIRRIEVELELGQLDINSNEKRAEKLFKLHQLEVEKYYSRTLYHTSYIFWIGCTCLALGFLFIFIFVFFKMDNTTISVIGISSGFFSNFIGAFYFKMYSESIKSVNEFHSRLVNTHHLHFANLLANKISNLNKREETFEKMSENLSHMGEEK